MTTTEIESPPLPSFVTAKIIRERLLPVGKRTLFRWIASNQFPQPDLRIGSRVFWKLESVQAWCEQNSAASMAQAAR